MKIILGLIVGACLGYAIGYWGKCSSGVCPLTRNPLMSSVIGALLGAVLMRAKH